MSRTICHACVHEYLTKTKEYIKYDNNLVLRHRSMNITFPLTREHKMRSRLLQSLLQRRKLFHEYFKSPINNVITYSQLKQAKSFSSNNPKEPDDIKNVQGSSHNLPGSINYTHKPFEDKDADIIFDVNENQGTINLDDLKSHEEYYNPYEGINLERGVTGVFEIEDLVSLLQRDNAKNIFVASVPPELSYVSYIVVVTGKSQKHMQALATFVRKVFKLKKCKTDSIPKIEGLDSKDWIALDLGNIALHIYSKRARSLYDLETLWSVGPDYDDKNKVTGIDIMDQYNIFLSNLEPMEGSDDTIKSDSA